jgi:hypothetical protein
MLHCPERLERGGPCRLLHLWQMGTHKIKMKEVLPSLVRWALYAGTSDFCPALVALVGPVQNIFFLTVHYDNLFVPIAQQPRQSCRIACLLMCVSDFALHTAPNKFMTLLLMYLILRYGTLKKILEREDQYLYVARRTFTNLFVGVTYLNVLRAVPDRAARSRQAF